MERRWCHSGTNPQPWAADGGSHAGPESRRGRPGRHCLPPTDRAAACFPRRQRPRAELGGLCLGNLRGCPERGAARARGPLHSLRRAGAEPDAAALPCPRGPGRRGLSAAPPLGGCARPASSRAGRGGGAREPEAGVAAPHPAPGASGRPIGPTRAAGAVAGTAPGPPPSQDAARRRLGRLLGPCGSPVSRGRPSPEASLAEARGRGLGRRGTQSRGSAGLASPSPRGKAREGFPAHLATSRASMNCSIQVSTNFAVDIT
ncbi:uncharacterized protein [Manis javanica]|uniref:uncharacterized protein n=1 Tax=Manis javanica TaxID=9974 RepID=UPI003C6D05B3